MNRSLKEYLIIMLKGISMGAADVVPGVSGGTMAFITGIYEELINSLKAIGEEGLQAILKFDLKRFWQVIHGNFLVAVFAGILISIITLSRLILYALAYHGELLWAFFFGLIIGAAIMVFKQIKQWNIGVALMGILGVAIAYAITTFSPTQTPDALWFVFLSGAIAICAMILPGISGSFILLLMGKYEFILNSLKELKLAVIITFTAGCLVGLLSFSHFLSWLLRKYHDLAVALLSGFMIGSLNKVWPWKITLETYTDRHGNLKPLIQENVLPGRFLAETGADPLLLWALLLAVVGLVLVVAIDSFSARTPETVSE